MQRRILNITIHQITYSESYLVVEYEIDHYQHRITRSHESIQAAKGGIYAVLRMIVQESRSNGND